MDKYGDATQAITTLMRMKLCESEEEAMEKVASGEAPGMIKDFKMKLFNEMTRMYSDNIEELDPELSKEFEDLRKEIEEE